jgi:hypothetical protein
MHQMPDIMQQRGGNQRRGTTLTLCLPGGLQSVLALRDIMQPVLAMALAINQIGQFLQARIFSICHDELSLTGHDFGSP